ncbi:MAG: (Fe-S)-binding protein [Nocardioides sp.]
MQIFAIVVSLAFAAVGIALFVKAIQQIVAVVRLGRPAPNRSNQPGARTLTLAKETLGHTRMLQWTAVGVGHWFVFVGFGLLFFTLLTAFGQLFDAEFALPLIGHFFVFEWATELFTWAMIIAIIAFIGYRASRPKERERGPQGRFYGSTMWQGYFVEAVILGVGLCIVTLRGLEYALQGASSSGASVLHFPLTFWLGEAFTGMSTGALENAVYLVAMLKIVISFTWMIVISLHPTMGVAWHRFTAFVNIWFKRKADGGTALGGLQPMMVGGVPIDFENIEDLDEDAVLGVGKIEDFAWKGILDFTSCTECGRCQSQCPAWNTDKPLSPKLFITNLRDHAYAKAPYLLTDADAGDTDDPAARERLPDTARAAAERELVGVTEGDPALPSGGAVIDPEVLWSCTSCGACVQQCPVDIEHVDHIIDMRRYQVLIESSFPSELNGLFKGLENKGNPWNMSPTVRMDWAKGLDFEVKQVGVDVDSLEEVDWLFWVGCAGAYEDRAKKTTRAVAELLHMAGVSFAVLGNGETCTGDPARRSGNEFVFQQLAMQNAEVFKESRVRKVVSTCAHCFNTLKNEYSQFGVELEVVHHTQLLNRLVREGKLTPVADHSGDGVRGRSITYHDPCFLGRHNQVYNPPRELLDVIPNTELKEMPRNSERSFCCGAGGARMWMEEKTGERINLNRTKEAVQTGADQIAVGCPFCRVMLSDGLTSLQADGSAREEVEVLDVAQLLLASVKRDRSSAPPPGSGAGIETAGVDQPVETRSEPETGDITVTADTVTEPSDVGTAAQATVTGDAATAAGPAKETEPVDAAGADPDSTDVTTEQIGSAESAAPQSDAAVQNQRAPKDIS